VPYQETFALLRVLPAVPTGYLLVRFSLLPERFGMPLPSVLRSLPSRVSNVSVPSPLLELSRPNGNRAKVAWSSPRTPRLTSSRKMESHLSMPQGQAAAWKRIRA
jgi:hypothetical protein